MGDAVIIFIWLVNIVVCIGGGRGAIVNESAAALMAKAGRTAALYAGIKQTALH